MAGRSGRPARPARTGSELPLWRRFTEGLRRMFAISSKRYLCDTCKYDFGNVCRRPERPNAIVCPDYKKR